MLKISNFKLFTSDKLILSVPDLIIESGSFTYIQGLNSSGKSLLLKTLKGSYNNFKGELIFKNRKILEHWKNNNILLLNSDLPVIQDISFLQNIELPLGQLSITQKNRLIEMATILEVIDILNVKMCYSSNSEKMLLYLIRAALISPGILLIDDLDIYFDNDLFKKVYQLFLYCLKSGIIIIATGKSPLNNVTLYMIKSGGLEKLCL